MTGSVAVGVQGEEGTGTDGVGVRDMLPQPHVLLPVRQEVCDPPVGWVWHIQQGELVLQQGWDGGVKSRAEVNRQDPGIGCSGIQVLQVEGHTYLLDPQAKLQGVQERVFAT